MSFRVISIGQFAFVALLFSLGGADARELGHLIPVEATFDVDGPYARTYARLCEQKLFAGPGWVIRYLSSSNVELGITITKNRDGKFWVTVKQAKPPMASILPVARGQKWNLKRALSMVEFNEAHAEIPEETVASIRDYWLSLLKDVRPSEATSPPLVISNKVTLFAKSAGGRILEGQLPSDADKHPRIYAAEDIVDDLTSVCAEKQKDRKSLFARIEEKAKRFTAANRKE